MPAFSGLIDSHCHLDDARNGDDSARQALIQAAAAAGVYGLVIPGVSPSEWVTLKALLTAQRTPAPVQLFGCYGIHPQVIPELSDEAVADGLAALPHYFSCAPSSESPSPLGVRALGVAVGECGLDGLTARAPGGELARQLEILSAQLDLAERLELPIVLHCLKAHDPLLRLLKHRGGVRTRAVLHSYSGSAEQVREYLELECWFSFAGPISYATARKPPLALKAVPLERLLVETDAPDQTPEPHRGHGHLNRSAYLPDVLRAMAHILEHDPVALGRLTAQNAIRFFGLEAFTQDPTPQVPVQSVQNDPTFVGRSDEQ